MKRSKKILVICFVVFMLALLYVSYDISRRTTFPGSKPQLKERIEKQFFKKDSIVKDSIKATHR